MAQEKNTDQVLDLAALAPPERPRAKFPDGKHYDLTVPNDLGILELKVIEQKSKAVGSIQKKKNLSADDIAGIKGALDELAVLLVRGAPADQLSKLSDMQKLAIVTDFNERWGDTNGSGEPVPLLTSGS